jgi:ParB/RepB/Spo0J family partition protein
MTEYSSADGHAVADHNDTPPPAAATQAAPIHDSEISEIAAVPVNAIVASPFNPRQASNAAADQELVDSVRQVGVLEPVLLRLHPLQPGDDPFGEERYELVFGHRRWRAAIEAGLQSIPAMIRELSDADSAQLQAIENLQREDLTVMDEARGYAAFIQAHGITKDQLAERIGKSRTHVYNRLKLAELVPAAADALLAGKINASTAEQIARVPTKHQPKALAIALEHFPFQAQRPFRQVRDAILEKFTLDLKTAIFDTSDAVLLELAGACTTCPKRSGQTPELYGDIIKRDEPLYKWGKAQNGSADICTDPDCFAEKKMAHLANQRAAIEAKGDKVIGGSAAMAAIDAQGNVKGAYIALGDVRDELAKLKKKPRKGEAGEDIAQPEVVLIQNPRNGQTVKAVKRADLIDAGAKVEKHAKVQNSWEANEKRRKAEQAKNEATADERTAQHMRLLEAVRTAAAAVPRTAFDLQLIARVTWEGVDYHDKIVVAKLHGFEHEHELENQIGQMDVDALGRFCLDCALVDQVRVHAYRLESQPENLLQAAKHYGVDIEAPGAPEQDGEQA